MSNVPTSFISSLVEILLDILKDDDRRILNVRGKWVIVCFVFFSHCRKLFLFLYVFVIAYLLTRDQKTEPLDEFVSSIYTKEDQAADVCCTIVSVVAETSS